LFTHMPDNIEQMELPLPELPEDINALYNRESDPACEGRSNLEEAAALQKELDGLATGVVQLETQKRAVEQQLASAKSVCRAIETMIEMLTEEPTP